MGKFEGMDPKLVRDLLSEVKQAADRMRDAEGKVTRLMSGAGLSSQSAHRPVQIADACDGMVRDVTTRVTLLEKRISQNATAPSTGTTAGESGDRPRVGDQSAESARRDDPRNGTGSDPTRPKDDSGSGDGSGTSGAEEAKPQTGSKGDETSPRDGSAKTPDPQGADDRKPDPQGADDRKPDPPGADDRKPDSPGAEDRKPDPQGADDRKPDSPGTEDRKPDPQGADDRKPDSPGADDRKPETGSKGDETSPRDGDTAPREREVIRTDPGAEAPRVEDSRQQAPERDTTPAPKAPERDAAPAPQVPERDAAPQAPRQDSVPEPPRQDSAPAPQTPAPEAPRQDALPEPPRQDSAPAPQSPAPDAPRADDTRPQVPRVEDLKPAVPGPGEGGQNGGQPVDTAPREAPRDDTAPAPRAPERDSVPQAPAPEAPRQDTMPEPPRQEAAPAPQTPAPEAPRQDALPEPPRQDSAPAPQTPTPQAPVPEAPGADATRPEIVDVNDRGQGAGDSTGTAPVNDPDAKGDPGTKGDERSPRQEGGTSGGPILDGPARDHPDDVDQSDPRPKVVEVDGVKVLQIPLDSPTAAEVDELLKNIEDIPPLQMPSAESVSATAAQPGWVEPHGPLDSARPVHPLLDTAGPATDQTVQPPGTGGDSGSTGTTSTGTTSTGTTSTGTTSTGTTSGEAPRPAGAAPAASAEPAVQATGEGTPRPAQAPTVGEALSGEARPAEGSAGWAGDGDEVVSARADPPDMDALRTLVENAREIEPLEMPGVQVPDGETWGEGAWAPMDVGPDGPAGDVGPADPVRPVPPPGGGR